jgi:hypothetical protein
MTTIQIINALREQGISAAAPEVRSNTPRTQVEHVRTLDSTYSDQCLEYHYIWQQLATLSMPFQAFLHGV